MKSSNKNIFFAFISIIDKNRSRYGGYIVHIGILMMFLGFTGKAFDKEADVSLSPNNSSTQLNEYKFDIFVLSKLQLINERYWKLYNRFFNKKELF